MKRNSYIILLFAVILIASCRSEQTTHVNKVKRYETQNFFPFSPDEDGLAFWPSLDYDVNTSAVILENVNLVSDFNLKYITTPKRKNPTVGWHIEKKNSKNKVIDIPITEIQLLGLVISKETPIDQVSPNFPYADPIENYLTKIEVFIRSDYSIQKYDETSSTGEFFPAKSELLASCQIDSCQEDLLTEQEIEVIKGYMVNDFIPLKPTYFNMVSFIEHYPDYWIEIVGTYRNVPSRMRFIKYQAVFQVSGTRTGK